MRNDITKTAHRRTTMMYNKPCRRSTVVRLSEKKRRENHHVLLKSDCLGLTRVIALMWRRAYCVIFVMSEISVSCSRWVIETFKTTRQYYNKIA